MGQSAEDIRDNIVKIVDENGEFAGTGFFIDKEYCVTCHHNVWQLYEIYVEREVTTRTGKPRRRKYHAQWIKEFSDVQKDIAFLKVKGSHFKALQYGRETYARMPVVVMGFPSEDLERHPDGKSERGVLSDVMVRLPWDEEEIQDRTKEWSVKPRVNVQVYNLAGNFDLGFSGAPVCHEHDWKVVGIFEAIDDTKGYIIPMNIVVEKFERFDLEKARKISSPSISLPSDSRDTQKLLRLGKRFHDKKEYAKAVEKYQAILSDPIYVSALDNMGSALSRLGKNEEAIPYFDRAIELKPNFAEVWQDKANALDDLGRYEEALKCYTKALEIAPSNVYAWNNKGIALYHLGQYEEALKCYTKALEIAPNTADILNNKGAVLGKLRRYEDSIPYFNRVIELKPNDAYAWNNKGIALYRLGLYEEADACYDKALEIDPNYADALYHRARLKVKKGDIENGLANLKEAIELDKNKIEYAKQDQDFGSIRNDERFEALI